jgi:zinc transporter ZupT
MCITIPEDRAKTCHNNSAYDDETSPYSSSVRITQPRNTSAAHPDLTIEATASPFTNNKKIGRNISSASLTSYTSYFSDSDSLSHELSLATTSYKSEMKSQRKERKMLTSLRSFLMVLALSIHSIFEGMAIGLEETEAGVWKLFLAVSIHATAIAFCIGTEMISSGTKKSQIVMYMVVLSIVTPIGVLIGIIVTVHMEQASGEHVLVIGMLQGLAGGTLLYITFFEVLARDKLSKYGMSGLVGALAVIVGFTLMAAMEAGAGGHSHGGHREHAGHAHIHHNEALIHDLKDETRHHINEQYHDGELHKEHDHDHQFETELRHGDNHHHQNEHNQKNEREAYHKDSNGQDLFGHQHTGGDQNSRSDNHEEEQNHKHEPNLEDEQDHENEDLTEHANTEQNEPNTEQDHNDKDVQSQKHNHDSKYENMYRMFKDGHNHEIEHSEEHGHNPGYKHNQEDEQSYENVQYPDYQHNHEHNHDLKDGQGQEHDQENNYGQSDEQDRLLQNNHNHEHNHTLDSPESNNMIKDEDNHEVISHEASKDEYEDEPVGIPDHEINVSVNVNEYFAYNVTDDKFLHDSADYHQE